MYQRKLLFYGKFALLSRLLWTACALKPLISVIIPTFNRADRLQKALDSVFAQTFRDFECILVDDGSTDETEKIFSSLPSVNYLKVPGNRGVSHARNLGIEQARGAYICFLDSDDRWEKEKLERQIEWMESNSQSRICYTDEIWIRNGVRVNPMNKHRKYSGFIFKQCLPLCIISPSSVMINKSIFDEIGVFDETMPACEDYDLWLRISAKFPVQFIANHLIIKTGGHKDQLSRKYWGMDRFRVYSLIKILAGNTLSSVQRKEALSTLMEKSGILLKGFLKRNKLLEAQYYRRLMEVQADQDLQVLRLPDLPPSLKEDFLSPTTSAPIE